LVDSDPTMQIHQQEPAT